jgi:Flp pilus assembly protein CpaB
MRSKKFGFSLFVLAMVSALTASVMVVHFVDSYRQVKTVVSAKKDILPYAQISPEDIEKKEVAVASTNASTLLDSNQAVGKFTRTIIPAGQILSQKELSTVENVNGGVALPLSEFKKGELRAIGVPEEFVHVLGANIKDQDHVDLVGVFSHDKVIFSKTLAYGVPVLRKNPIDQGGGVIVAVTAEQAQEIALAMNNGKLVVSVTPYQFDAKPLPSTNLDTLLGVAPK